MKDGEHGSTTEVQRRAEGSRNEDGGRGRRDPVTRSCALERIADQLGVHPEALRTWVKRAEVDDGVRPGTTTDYAERIAQLERENRELRRANTVLKQASAFFAAEIDRPQH